MSGACGFVQASKEDFGISVVEAQACGIPVLAFGEGGAKETVLDAQNTRNPTGLFFYEQSEQELIEKIMQFLKLDLKPGDCKKNAKKFSARIFRDRMLQQITSLTS